jgi:hypothetical protein
MASHINIKKMFFLSGPSSWRKVMDDEELPTTNKWLQE